MKISSDFKTIVMTDLADLRLLAVSWLWERSILIKPSPPFFFRLASNAFPDVGRSVGLKKKKPQTKNHKKSRNRRPWYPRMALKVTIHIFGLTKCTICCKKSSCFRSCFPYAVTTLIFQMKRIISSEKWFNYVVTFFFFENAKNLDGSDDAKRRKKRGWPYVAWEGFWNLRNFSWTFSTFWHRRERKNTKCAFEIDFLLCTQLI